jgi:hypothetical protein
MPKTTTVTKINVFGAQFSVTFTKNTNKNPFKLYMHYTDYDPAKGYPVNHKKMIAAYQNYESCLYHLLGMRLEQFRRDYFPLDLA